METFCQLTQLREIGSTTAVDGIEAELPKKLSCLTEETISDIQHNRD